MKRVLIILCCVLALQSCNKDNTKNETINGFDINWNGDLNKDEKDAIRDVIANMVKVEGGTFYMGAQKDSLEYLNYDEYALPYESPVHEVTGIRETRDYLKFFSFSCFEIFRFIFKFVPIIN